MHWPGFALQALSQDISITMAAGSSAQSTIQTHTELGEWEGQEGGGRHAPDPGLALPYGVGKGR